MYTTCYQSSIKSLPLLGRGKVRDIYAVDQDKLLIVATDRISAFDVIMHETIPGKGIVLTKVSEFWFGKLCHIIRSQLTGLDPENFVAADEREQIRGRSMLVRRLKPLPIEAVVRGYIIGSGWKDYQNSGQVCGISLPAGLQLAQQLPEPIFTPANKAEMGEHDENISFSMVQEIIGNQLAELVRSTSLRLYKEAVAFARVRGIIIADTKFEFGLDESGKLHLIDEVLTPDSSRFWLVSNYQQGSNPPSFDKQFLRDYLEASDWNKSPPPPQIPNEIINQTAGKYHDALQMLTGENI